MTLIKFKYWTKVFLEAWAVADFMTMFTNAIFGSHSLVGVAVGLVLIIPIGLFLYEKE